MNLYLEFDSIVHCREEADIRYAIAGGLAVGLHGYLRATEDMDFLLHPDDLKNVFEIVRKLGYVNRSEPWTFKETQLTLWRFLKPIEDTEDTYVVDILVPETADCLDIIGRALTIPYSDITVRVVTKKDLIEMKKRRGSKMDEIDIDYLASQDEDV